MPGDDCLTAGARAALTRARAAELSYGVRVYVVPGDNRRLLVVLGEAHLKLGGASGLGQEIVSYFALRGVETFQQRQIAAGRLLGLLINGPRFVLRALSLGMIKGSTITDAKNLRTGDTVELERTKVVPFGLHIASIYLTAWLLIFFLAVLWAGRSDSLANGVRWLSDICRLHLLLLIPAIALRDRHWSWIIHPFMGLVTLRDVLMAEGTVRMLDEHRDTSAALAIMGRAHLPGYERELLKRGFRRVEL